MTFAASCRNVIFDLDGTLVDSKPGIVAGLRHTFGHLGHALTADHNLDWAIGPPLREVLAQLLLDFSDTRVDLAVATYRSWYGAVGLFDARPYPGVAEVLAGLAGAGKRLFVGTAKRTNFARTVLEHFGLAPLFRSIHGTEPHGRFDRKTDLIRYVLEVENLTREETVVVGDREHDVTAARANGLRVIGAAYGYGTREELAAADILCENAVDLARLL
jgi:phosphoglycolate phosphatase